MRLLRFNASGGPILTDFRGKPIPPYAILSHRWSSSEILIEDVSNGNYKEKEKGYRKLRFCAEQAAQDGLQYFWIDTCCIDLWDNNERSKAINSMFEWYRKAARCYVFLSDVSVASTTAATQRSSWEASFRESDWFTRGWTLQELIAPVSVDFFSREGLRLGDKASLDQLLHDITDVPLAVLHNCPLEQFSIPERMRWAEKRTTSEEEDIVYCLLGLVGISMPITYGEGQESARRRLEAEMEANGSAPSIIPFSQNESFVGRESQLVELEAKLFSNVLTTTTLAIVGPGGTGKSQLALEVAHRTRQNNKHCSVFWIDASDKDSLYQSYTVIAQKLGISGVNDDLTDTKQVVKRCVAEMSGKQCLLIFDNAEDTILRSSSSSAIEAADLAECVPQSKLCSAIFTTTNSDTAQALAPQNVIALQDVTADPALKMLHNYLARPLSDGEQQEARDLLRELSYLPIAVVQAAACMNASSMTVQEYRAHLNEHEELALGYSSGPSEGEAQDSGVTNPVATTLSVSMDQITRRGTCAVDYLCLAACLARKDILTGLLEASSPQTREHAIKLLNKYALVTRRPADCAIDLHRLVHQILRKRLQMQGQLVQWAQIAISQLILMFPDDGHGNRSKWRRLLPHVRCAMSHIPADHDDHSVEKLYLAWRCAMALNSDGRYEEAGKLQVEVLQSRRRVLGNEHPFTLSIMNNLALTYDHQGRWKEAEELQVQVMHTMKRVLGNEHPYTLAGTLHLSFTYSNQGRLREAEQLQVQVMQTRKRLLGSEHPDTLIAMSNLALTCKKQGRWREAEELEMQVMQKRKRVLGDVHPCTLTSMGNLALTYSNQGRWKEAETLQTQVVETTKRVLGEVHPFTLNSLSTLAQVCWDCGRFKKAEELHEQVLKISKRVLGEEHPDTLETMHNLACVLQSQARYKEAIARMEKCFQSRQQVLGEQHRDTVSSLDMLNNWQSGRSNESL